MPIGSDPPDEIPEDILACFIKVLEERKVPAEDRDSWLRDMAGQHKELLLLLDSPQMARLPNEAAQAAAAGSWSRAETLLEEAAAEIQAGLALLQRIQLRHARAAECWMQAADLLPPERRTERASWLHNAAYDLHSIGFHSEALPLFEESLGLSVESGDSKGECVTLNNLAAAAYKIGDYDKARSCLEQSLAISLETGDKAAEAVTCWNIGMACAEQNDLAAMERYISRAKQLAEEVFGGGQPPDAGSAET